jgi:isoquinoline 1-oxidoreductase beta subunit
MNPSFTSIQNFSRRDALKLFGVAGGGLALGASALSWSPMAMAQGEDARLNIFIAIGEDDKVYLTCHRSEMGQGIRTGIPQVLADELGADWDKVVVVQGLADKRYGSQNTDGSRSIRKGFDKMREMGAMARTMLEQAAANKWQVPVSELNTANNQVIHIPSGKVISFGELALAASQLALPKVDTLVLKSPKDFTHIGKPHKIVDMQAMLKGEAKYGYDIKREGMRYASIVHPPVLGSDIKTLDDSKARKIAGVIDVIRLPIPKGAPAFQPLGGVAVIATNSWSAIEGRKALIITWSDSVNDTHDSHAFLKLLVDRVQAPGKMVRQQGEHNKDWPEDKTIKAIYTVPYLTHAPMEPPVATAHVTDGACEIWASTQTPQSAAQNVAGYLGLKEEQVKINVTLLGGGFGRKSKPDYCVEAAILSQQLKAPVKVCWSREDDIQNGYLHAISAQLYQARLGDDQMPQAILQRTGFPTIGSTFAEGADYPAGWELDLGFVDVPLMVKSLRCETVEAKAHTRIGWMRSVCNIQHGFGIGCFVDELAVKANKPATQMWRELLGNERQETFTDQGFKYGNYGEDLKRHPVDIARYHGVIDVVELGMSKGGQPKANQAWGFAVHRSFAAFVAVAILVEVDKDKKLTILRAVAAIDAGVVVNPDRVKSQTEGAIMFGLSLAMMGEISFKEGKVQQSNFHDYPLLRMAQCPNIEVSVIPSVAPPGGVGEPGVPPVAPSLTNAIFAASGLRIRDLPVSKYLTV